MSAAGVGASSFRIDLDALGLRLRRIGTNAEYDVQWMVAEGESIVAVAFRGTISFVNMGTNLRIFHCLVNNNFWFAFLFASFFRFVEHLLIASSDLFPLVLRAIFGGFAAFGKFRLGFSKSNSEFLLCAFRSFVIHLNRNSHCFVILYVSSYFSLFMKKNLPDLVNFLSKIE